MAVNKKEWFMIDNKPIYLTHGNYGGSLKCAFHDKLNWQRKLEFNPHHFINYELFDELIKSRNQLSNFLDCDSKNLVFFPNPSTALNTVIKSLNLNEKDEVLTSNHEYGALDKTWDFYSRKKGYKYIKVNIDIPFNDEESFVKSFKKKINNNTKVIFLSHITSSTALLFPVKKICEIARENDIITIIDGAHVPGHINLSISEINPDVYVGACHKWMCTPKGVSFLYTKKSFQNNVEPLVISWGWKGEIFQKESEYINWHQWQGTNDLSSFLTIPSTINFFNENNWNKVSQECRELIIELKNKFLKLNSNCMPTSFNDKYLTQMLSFTVNQSHKIVKEILTDSRKILSFQKKIFEKANIHIPVILWNEKVFMRVSVQAYNKPSDIDKMFEMLKSFNLL